MRTAKKPQRCFEKTRFKFFFLKGEGVKKAKLNHLYFLEQTHEGKLKLFKSDHKPGKGQFMRIY